MSSSITVASLPRLSATDLSEIILGSATSNVDANKALPSKIGIVDVRDDDHIGGHIISSIHAPSHTLDHAIPSLVRQLRDKETVVFHCALSQQRGPSAALRYIRERERLVGPNSVSLQQGSGVGEVLRKNKEEEIKRRGKGVVMQGEGDEEGWEDVEREDVYEDNMEGTEEKQKVFVLDRGFVGWQERFGEDVRLTEGYRKEIWKEGYWM